MISLTAVFYIFIGVFLIIGAIRGWAKEMLVSFSVALVLFIIFLLEDFAGPIVIPFSQLDENYSLVVQAPEEAQDYDEVTGVALERYANLDDTAKAEFKRQFAIRVSLMVILVFFGYQTPGFSKFAPSVKRDKIQDVLLGAVFGVINGFLIVGTIWAYMHSAHYPFDPYIVAPLEGTDPLYDRAAGLIKALPPFWLGTSPWIYIAVVVSFLFVLVVFI